MSEEIETKAGQVTFSLENVLDSGISDSTKLEILALLLAGQQISELDYDLFVEEYIAD